MTSVLDAVNSATDDARERLALLIGALLEGGSLGEGPFPVGDNGTSYGPWQFHFPTVTGTKLGLTPEQAQDPALAVHAILPSYSAAVKRVSDALWESDPATAAATAAYYAEQPAYMYPIERIKGAWSTLTGSGGGGAVPVDFNPLKKRGEMFGIPVPFPTGPDITPSPGDMFGGITEGVKGVANALVSVAGNLAGPLQGIADPRTWWRILFVIAGGAMILLGVGWLNKHAMVEAAGTFTGAAARAV